VSDFERQPAVPVLRGWFARQNRWFQVTFAMIILVPMLTVVGVLVLNLLSVRFIASPSHAQGIWPIFAVIGLVVGLPSLILVVGNLKPGTSWFKKALLIVGIPLLISGLFHFFALNGVPAILAAILHQEQSIVFTVKEPEAINSKYCKHRIKFADFEFAELCNVPDDLRHSLTAGQKVALHGHGSSWGIFVDSIAPVSQ
jgi:hypothetical protein